MGQRSKVRKPRCLIVFRFVSGYTRLQVEFVIYANIYGGLALSLDELAGYWARGKIDRCINNVVR